ncbi:MAG: hypothetical protein V3V08_21310 [Nannocystaceae bacterium]
MPTHSTAVAQVTNLPRMTRNPDGSYGFEDPYKRFFATVHTDGSVTFRRGAIVQACSGSSCASATPRLESSIIPLTTTVGFLPLSATMRLRTVFLRRTFELRLTLVENWQRKQNVRALVELAETLNAIWASSKSTATEKRATIFQLWLECDANPTPGALDALSGVDKLRRKAAREARRRIEASIRRHAPRGSRPGYNDAQIRAWNKMVTDGRPFSPYESDRQDRGTRDFGDAISPSRRQR